MGGKSKARPGRPSRESPKTPVVALVERGTGRVRTKTMARVTSMNLFGAIRENMDTEATLMTDGYPAYGGLVKKHETVNHNAGEYVRGNVHTNTVEGFFSLLKRGINGTFHHVSRGHLQR